MRKPGQYGLERPARGGFVEEADQHLVTVEGERGRHRSAGPRQGFGTGVGTGSGVGSGLTGKRRRARSRWVRVTAVGEHCRVRTGSARDGPVRHGGGTRQLVESGKGPYVHGDGHLHVLRDEA